LSELDGFEETSEELAGVLDKYIEILDDKKEELDMEDIRKCLGDAIFCIKELIGWVRELREKIIKSSKKMNSLFKEEKKEKKKIPDYIT